MFRPTSRTLCLRTKRLRPLVERTYLTSSISRSLTLRSGINPKDGPRKLARGFVAGSGKRMGEVKEFLLADIGEGIAEVEVLEWTVEPGTKVEEFDELLKVQSDKAATEITSPYEGKVVELMVAAGDMAQVGKPLCRIELEGESSTEEAPAAAAAPEAATKQKVADAAPTEAKIESDFKTGKVLTSPAVRRLAKDNDIDLVDVVGSGPKGRVLKEDVIKYMENGIKYMESGPRGVSAAATSKAETPSPPPSQPAAATPTPRPAPPVPSAEDIVVPVRGLDRIMVQTMQAAHTVPSLLYSDEFPVDQLITTRTYLKEEAAALGIKLTYLPFIVKAASMALTEFPKLNSHVNEDCTEYTLKADHNIGVAVQTDSGLMVPNVKQVQTKSVLQIASELAELQNAGHSGKITSEQLKGGSFTISNIGSIGGTVCKPLIVVPEVAIAALGKFQALPRFDENDSVVKSTIMNVSISADHRIIDGATVAMFSNLWQSYLANPMKMLLHTK